MRKQDLKKEILQTLSHKDAYGYEINKVLKERDFSVHTGYLYSILREMEDEGLIQGIWKKGERGPPKRLYSITPLGKETLRVGSMPQRRRSLLQMFMRMRTVIAMAVTALILTDVMQFYKQILLKINVIPSWIATLALVLTITFIFLKRPKSYMGWLAFSVVIIMEISLLFPPHAAHFWQATYGFIISIAGLTRADINLFFLGVSLIVASVTFHAIALQIYPGPLHNVYIVTAWLGMFVAMLSITTFYLHPISRRIGVHASKISNLERLSRLEKSMTVSGLKVAEGSRVIRAPKRVVWELLTNMEDWPKWVFSDGFRVLSHNVISVKGNTMIVDELSEVDGKKIWSRDKYVLYPEERVEESFIEGPMRGRMIFTLEEVDGGTKISILTEIGFIGMSRLKTILNYGRIHKKIITGFLDAFLRALEHKDEVTSYNSRS